MDKPIPPMLRPQCSCCYIYFREDNTPACWCFLMDRVLMVGLCGLILAFAVKTLWMLMGLSFGIGGYQPPSG